MVRTGSFLALVALGLSLFVSPAAADIEADAYLGGAFTNNSRLQSSLEPQSAHWDSSIAVGLRGTYWFEGKFDWIGLAADWSYFKPKDNNSSVEIQTFPLTPLLMVRIPLFRSEEFAAGRLTPYAAVGPGIFFSRIGADGSGSKTDVPVGLDYRFGLSLMFTKQVGLFSEYRYASAKFKFKASGIRYKTRLNMNLASVGVKLRF
jgi:opacity protein-like surface antigen